jgi:Domain of unknown function (DUF397)
MDHRAAVKRDGEAGGAPATGQRISYDATSGVQMQVHLHITRERCELTRATEPGEGRVSSHRRWNRPFQGWRPAAERDETVDLVPRPLLPAQLRAAKWRKSRHSNPSGNCVEMARLPGEQVAVRDSHRPDGPALLFTRAAWECFLRGVREGAAELALAGREATDGERPAKSATVGDLQWFAVIRP